MACCSSGERGKAEWQNDEENVKRTRAVLQTLLEDFYTPEYYDTVTSIELLNEPAGFVGGNMMDIVKQFYYDGYGQVSQTHSRGRTEQSGRRADAGSMRVQKVRYPHSPDGNTTASSLLLTWVLKGN